MGSQTKKGFILVLLHEYKSLEELRSAAKEGIVDENGTMLQVSGEIKNFGQRGVAVDFTGTVKWQQAKAHGIALLSPFGVGVMVLVAVEAAFYSQDYTRLAKSMAKNMKSFKPEVP